MTIKDVNQSLSKLLLVFLISTTLMPTAHALVIQDKGLVNHHITFWFGFRNHWEQQLTLFQLQPYSLF